MIVAVATTNPGKLRELAALLGPRLELRPAPPEYRPVEERGGSYLENARLKARALHQLVRGPALADDSGLEVDALGGRPGVESARYGDSAEERNRRLLDELRGRRGAERRARFRTALVLVLGGGREAHGEGACEGRIAEAPYGGGGFGYDPIFLVPDLGRTFAELSSEEKNRRSARSLAARALLAEIDRELGRRG
ncbi:MAG: RdgB/HAM1 family non-canonical purine NTP pyrophosphatase [Deltaproteobacteria bacterium]|nr:RdgB/HAM1 family non-canonical purine NTP pyrophosphatase [Deltaproteobacteria bacterium]